MGCEYAVLCGNPVIGHGSFDCFVATRQPQRFDVHLSEFETLDSGEPIHLASGMIRDNSTGKPRFDLLRPENLPYEQQMLTRFALLLGRGAEVRGGRNWEQANSAEDLARFKESAARHFEQWFAGETDEDHASALWFNVMGAEYVRYQLASGTARSASTKPK